MKLSLATRISISLIILNISYAWARVFKIGLLLSRNSTTPEWCTSVAAIHLAIDRIQEENSLPGIKFKLSFRDSVCDQFQDIGAVLELIEQENVDVILGPNCYNSLLQTAALTTYKKIFHLVWSILAWPSSFRTLVGLAGMQREQQLSISFLFEKFRWETCAIIKDPGPGVCQFLIEKDNGFFLPLTLEEFSVHGDTNNPGVMTAMITYFLERIKNKTRVVIVCLRPKDYSLFFSTVRNMSMAGPEYVYIVPSDFQISSEVLLWNINETTDLPQAKRGYEINILQIYLQLNEEKEWKVFYEQIENKIRVLKYNDTYQLSQSLDNNEQQNKHTLLIYDAVLLYALIINETLHENQDVKDGELLHRYVREKEFQGITGHVVFDRKAGQRVSGFWIDKIYGDYVVVRIGTWSGMLSKEQFKPDPVKFTTKFKWFTPGNNAPSDKVPCEVLRNCKPIPVIVVERRHYGGFVGLAIILLFAFVGSFLGAYSLKRKRLREELKSTVWKIPAADIRFNMTKLAVSQQSVGSLTSCNSHDEFGDGVSSKDQIFTEIAHYKGQVIAVKRIQRQEIIIETRDFVEFANLRKLSHENINPFIGACIDPGFICILMDYCIKGSLQDVLENETIKLDWIFKFSFLWDIASGMAHLHSSPIKSHGKLKSSNCVIDSRWVLKITDYGLYHWQFPPKPDENIYTNEYYRGKLWTSPELLRWHYPPLHGTQKGDVYSFAIILFEIVYECFPYNTYKRAPKDIISRLVKVENPVYRPRPHKSNLVECDERILMLMKFCWEEDPDVRPEFHVIKRRLKEINKGRKLNIMENLMNMMERYASNLEKLVEERTQELTEEKKRADLLLRRMLPPKIAEQLKNGEIVEPKSYERTTIYFSDIVSFTSLATISTPKQVVTLLNTFYSIFDDTIKKYDVYKVETISEAYMVVSGAPEPNDDHHVTEIANMSLDLLSEMTAFKVPHLANYQVQLRIGLNTGPTAAGVVGLYTPRYCLFGDTVSYASKMESYGKGMRIHISSSTYNALLKVGGYLMSQRGDIEIKGKGVQRTYWLQGKIGFKKPLPQLITVEEKKSSNDFEVHELEK